MSSSRSGSWAALKCLCGWPSECNDSSQTKRDPPLALVVLKRVCLFERDRLFATERTPDVCNGLGWCGQSWGLSSDLSCQWQAPSVWAITPVCQKSQELEQALPVFLGPSLWCIYLKVIARGRERRKYHVSATGWLQWDWARLRIPLWPTRWGTGAQTQLGHPLWLFLDHAGKVRHESVPRWNTGVPGGSLACCAVMLDWPQVSSSVS